MNDKEKSQAYKELLHLIRDYIDDGGDPSKVSRMIREGMWRIKHPAGKPSKDEEPKAA